MQALDILVLAQLAADGSKPSARTLGEQLELPPSTLQRSLGRLRQAGLIDGDGVDGSLHSSTSSRPIARRSCGNSRAVPMRATP